MRVCLFEDHGAVGLEPLTLTRAAPELLCGCTTLADKQYRYFPATERGLLVRPELAAVVEERVSASVNETHWLRSGQVVMVNGRWLPPAPSLEAFDSPCVGLIDNEVAFAVLPTEQLRDCSPD